MAKKNDSDGPSRKKTKGAAKKLKLAKETVKDLSAGEAGMIKGGLAARSQRCFNTDACPTVLNTCACVRN